MWPSVIEHRVFTPTLSLDTLKTILSNLVKCRDPLIKMAVKLDKTMEIARDGEPF